MRAFLVKYLTCALEVPGMNFRRDIDYPDEDFFVVSIVYLGNCRKSNSNSSFHILSNSLPSSSNVI
jgi:hypothetical protein